MSAALKLEIYENGEFLREVPFSVEELWVGRDEDCVIRLEDRAISRKHGSFKISSEGVDFAKKSVFGEARVNGKDVEQASLKNGDRLLMGPYEIRVKQTVAAPAVVAPVPVPVVSEEVFSDEMPNLGEAPAASTSPGMDFGQPEGVEALEADPIGADPTGQHPGTASALNGNASQVFDFSHVESDASTKVFNQKQSELKAVLQFSDGAANVNEYEITDDEVAIGRSQKCHIVLEDKRSSRKHSIILREGKKFWVQDLGSANGTLVNGERVDRHELQAGDVIQIGDTRFTFQMLQADYALKKDQFIQVPVSEAQPPAMHQPAPMMEMMDGGQFQAASYEQPAATPQPDFAAPAAEKKSFIGKFLDRYRAMNTKQQIIWGAAILAGVYFMLDDDAPQKRAHLNTGNATRVVQKKTEKKPGSGSGVSFESLTPEQQRYIETEYQLSFDLFKNREYDNSLLEVGKIFSLVQDYKNAREIEAFAREGKRKLEAQDEEKKRQEVERQAQIRLQNLIEQAGMLMEKKRYTEAEALFAEIELLQPENAAVGTWRKQLIAEKERMEHEIAEKKRNAAINEAAWVDFAKAKLLATEQKKYWDALDAYDDLLTRPVTDKKFITEVKQETKRVEDYISSTRDPLFAQAHSLEQEGKMTEAYKMYQKVYEVDPTYTEAMAGMERIRGSITGKAKVIYAEGVFAESYSDWDTAEKRYREVMDGVPSDDPYFIKANSRLKKLLVLRQPASSAQ